MFIKKNIFKVSILVIFCCSFSSVFASVETDYQKAFSQGNYSRAQKIILDAALVSDDASFIEKSIIRTKELRFSAEQDLLLQDYYQRLLNESAVVAQNSFLRDRLKISLLSIFLNQGKFNKAKVLKKELGFIDQYNFLGPFHLENKKDFEKNFIDQKNFDLQKEYDGFFKNLHWHSLKTRRDGSLSLSDYYSLSENNVYYFQKEFIASSDGSYDFIFGKTNVTEMTLDGQKIFKNKENHNFDFDQYYCKIKLSKGKHTLLIKTASFYYEPIFSLRILDPQKKGLDFSLETKNEKTGKILKIEEVNYTPLVKNAIKNVQQNLPAKAFDAAYLLLALQLNSLENEQVDSFFQICLESSQYRNLALYYYGLFLVDEDPDTADYLLQICLKENPQFLPAYYIRSLLKVDQQMTYEVADSIEKMKEINSFNPYYYYLRAILATSENWTSDFWSCIGKLESANEKSLALNLKKNFYLKKHQYSQAQKCYQQLEKSHYYDYSFSLEYYNILKECHQQKEAISYLKKLIYVFPENIDLYVELAILEKKEYGLQKGLATLAAAQQKAPNNVNVLKNIALFYTELGKKDLAINFFYRVLEINPNDFLVKRYLNILKNKGNSSDLLNSAINYDQLLKDCEKYDSESAVILLDKEEYSLNLDGSSEQKIHKVIKINNEEAIRNYNQQYTVINPSSDQIENFRCLVINNEKVVRLDDYYTQSLSKPESRLYYNLIACIVDLPNLKKGSIIDFSYTIKSKAESGFGIYYGNKIYLGDNDRILEKSISVKYPTRMNLYCKTKGIALSKIQHKKKGNISSYSLNLKNLSPLSHENGMPSYQELLPTVYFCTHQNWNDFYKWYSSLLIDRSKMNSEMRKDLEKVLAGAQTDLEKVDRIYNFVTGKIRYVGFEFGIGGIQPRSPEKVYHTEMGDCKDIALLLVTLLRDQGIDAGLALVRTKNKGEANFDSAYYGEFNHAICYVNLAGGFFLDGTTRYSGIHELPEADRGVKSLVVFTDRYEFIETDKPFYIKDETIAQTKVEISDQGSALLNRRIQRIGNPAVAFREVILKKEEFHDYLTNSWNNDYVGSQIGKVFVKPVKKDQAIDYSYDVFLPKFINTKEKVILLNLFLRDSSYFKDYVLEQNRETDLIINYDFYSTDQIEYLIPLKYQITNIPQGKVFDNEYFFASFEFIKNEKNMIKVKNKMYFKKTRITPDEYPQFKLAVNELLRYFNQKAVIEERK